MPRLSLFGLFGFLLFFSCIEEEQVHKPKTFRNAAVVSAHPLASKIGVNILKSGGNAFDASVAVHFALSVVFPYAGNLGGGGFAVFHTEKGVSGSLDFREKAPLKAHRNMYLDSTGNVIAELSAKGALASGIPGSVDGMWQLHKKYGKLNWSELIQPSIELSKNGWIVTNYAAEFMNKYAQEIEDINGHSTYLTERNPWSKGDTIRNKHLSRSLKLIADNGPEVFYEGEIADSIVSTMQNKAGIITKEDLRKYESKWRKTIIGEYKDYQIVSMPPPSSGGWALISMLKMIDNYPIRDWGRWDFRTINTICEIEKRVYADRSKYLGDADFFAVPLDTLLSDKYLNSRIKDHDINKAINSDLISSGSFNIFEGEETTHFSIVDEEGNAIAITTTINSAYGSKLLVNGCGFLLNNQMNDFSIKPGFPNNYGLVGGEANAIQPEKRMLSSMTPTIILKDNKPFLILGSPGGSTIITSILQNIINVIDFGFNMQQSVIFPRFHHQWLPDSLYYEKGFFRYVDSIELLKTGHNLQERLPIGRVDAILLNSDGFWECGEDPRRDDFADGY